MKTNSKTPRTMRLLSLFGALACLGLGSAPIASATEVSVLARSGTVYELRDTNPDGSQSSELLLRTVRSGLADRWLPVPGTGDYAQEIPGDIQYEETTGSVFLVFTKLDYLQSRVEFAVYRAGRWISGPLAPSMGFYVSMNPKIIVTRQRYLDYDVTRQVVSKTRSILSIVWWEEAYTRQARYAPIFVEDGDLRLDDTQAYNMPELAGDRPSSEWGNYPSAVYSYPGVDSDPTSNGGVRVTFASLATGMLSVVKIGFPEDLTQIDPRSTPSEGDKIGTARGHTPVGRIGGRTPLVREIDTSSPVYAALSTNSVPTLFWREGNEMVYRRADAPAGSKPVRLSLDSKLSADRAERLIREMASRD
jgi:hypothetical protein